MSHEGGYGNQDDDGTQRPAQDAVPPPPPMIPGEFTQADLHDESELVELKRDDDRDGDETPATKQKKTKEKKSKNQKGTPLLFDFPRSVKAEEQEVYPETQKPVPKQSFQGPQYTAPSSNMWGISGTAVSQAWNAAAVGRRMEAAQNASDAGTPQMPADHQQKISMLVNTTGCSETTARELLEKCSWNLDLSADAFFREDTGNDDTNADDRPRWGPRAGASQVVAQRQQEQAAQHMQASREAYSASQDAQAQQAAEQPPAPTQPPPPRLPPDWQALWNEEQQNYYYWHVPTNHTTWDAPSLDQEEAAQAMAIAATERAAAEAEDRARAEAEAEAAERARQEEERQSAIRQVCHITGVDEARARSFLESNQWQMEPAIRAFQAEEERRKQQRQAEAMQQEALRYEAARTEHRRADDNTGRSRRCSLGEQICIRHWRPKTEVRNICLRLFHGERVHVTWIDDKEEGWAYGYAVDDEGKCGYFPQAVLIEVPHTPHQRKVHEFYRIRDEFQAPQEVEGYLGVTPGDIVRVLHPLDQPFVWAYVQLEPPTARAGRTLGWIPEAVLCEAADAHGEQGPRPPG